MVYSTMTTVKRWFCREKPCVTTVSNPSLVEARINAQLVTIIMLREFMQLPGPIYTYRSLPGTMEAASSLPLMVAGFLVHLFSENGVQEVNLVKYNINEIEGFQ